MNMQVQNVPNSMFFSLFATFFIQLLRLNIKHLFFDIHKNTQIVTMIAHVILNSKYKIQIFLELAQTIF